MHMLVVAALGLALAGADTDAGKCPISGKPAKAEFSLNVNGKQVSFCCNNCPKAYMKKIALTDEGPKKCPLSGKDAKAETQLIHLKASTVAFCCNNCQKKFMEKEKMELVDKGPKTCKVCDKEAKADQSVLANGEKIYFCCGECKAGWQKKLHLTSTEGTKCPLSGKDINKDTEIVVVKSNAVYFCCDNCKGKYLKETILKGEGEGAKKTGKDKID